LDDEAGNWPPMEAEALSPSQDMNATQSSTESRPSEQSTIGGESLSSAEALESRSAEGHSDPGLWRSLQNLGNQKNQSDALQDQKVPLEIEDYYDEEDEADDDDYDDEDGETLDYAPEAYNTYKEARRQDGSENQAGAGSRRSISESSPGESYGMFIRFLPLAATETDLRAAFDDCGEIVRAQAMVPRGSGLKFTYGFVDFSVCSNHVLFPCCTSIAL
jgi:hypothetical protein